MAPPGASGPPGVLAGYKPFNPLKLFSYTQNQNDENVPPLQDTAVRYRGQVIGLVVAEEFEQARDAATLVDVSYAAQPPSAPFTAGLPAPVPAGTPPDELAPGRARIA